MYIGVLPACLSVYHMHAVPKDQKRGQIPQTVVIDGDIMWVLGTEPRSLEEQPVLLITEPLLQPFEVLLNGLSLAIHK